MGDRHEHGSVVHAHTHHHVTHYLSGGQEWTHFMATHDHEHNHSKVEHIHQEHTDDPEEHDKEAHIHDHASPADSPG